MRSADLLADRYQVQQVGQEAESLLLVLPPSAGGVLGLRGQNTWAYYG